MTQDNDNSSEADETVTDNVHDLAAKQTEQLSSELEKAKNDFLYLRAEFDNYRKHAIKERSDLMRYAGERLLVDILSVLDNFDLALSSAITSSNVETFRKGIEMIHGELKSVVQKYGAEEIASEGKPFDPTMHEALSSEETDKYPAGTITRVFKRAYKFHDKILRPGQVIIAKAPSNDN